MDGNQWVFINGDHLYRVKARPDRGKARRFEFQAVSVGLTVDAV
jgi:hypothetical protein